MTLSSGVTGYTTIHAGSARQALSRLRFVCQLADHDIPFAALNTLVSESVDIVVHCARTAGQPQVTEIVAVEDQASAPDSPQFTVADLFASPGPDHALEWSGNVPARAGAALRLAGFDPTALMAPDALPA